MAATIQPDPYDILIRRIGYSVGLEETLNRVRDLVELYSRKGELHPSDWQALVHTKWGRKTDDIANVFKALKLIYWKTGAIYVLSTLDELAIIRRLWLASFESALRFILTKQILLSDGDIFLNCLAAHFQKDRIASNLRQMIRFKRGRIQKVFRNRDLLEKLFAIVSIEMQKTNTGGASAGQRLSDKVRREPLTQVRTTHLSANPSIDPEPISEDYLRKVSVTRRGWAQSLKLSETDGKLTDLGEHLLRALRSAGFEADAGALAFWPLRHEWLSLRVSPEALGVDPTYDMWRFLLTLSDALGASSKTVDVNSLVRKRSVELIEAVFSAYQELNIERRMLRRELPVEILYTITVAKAFAESTSALPLQEVLAKERDAHDSRIVYRSSRAFEGAISLRS